MTSDVMNSNSESEFIQAYVLDMDIKENMAYLKSQAGIALGLNLSEATVWVLSQKQLSDFETLQELCGSFAGDVQIQFLITFMEASAEQRIDILDVLKPNEGVSVSGVKSFGNESETGSKESSGKKLKKSKWIASTVFKDIQRRYGIPQNPELWTVSHVDKWLAWAKEQFTLEDLNPNKLKLDGQQLCQMKVDAFHHLVPNDPDDIFYMHYELLRKTHIVAVMYHSLRSDRRRRSPSKEKEEKERANVALSQERKLNQTLRSEIFRLSSSSVSSSASSSPSPLFPVDPVEGMTSPPRSGSTEVTPPAPLDPGNASSVSSQPMQLWQFLLKLLTDADATEVISWCGESGEFKFHQPDLVAKLWGEQKGKSNMTYEKLSRSLRYYYEADKKIIKKVNNKRFVYRFQLDLRDVLGYDSAEIQDQISYVKKISLSKS